MNELKNNSRDITLDIIKGILIVAVVTGHVFSYLNSNLDNNIPFLLIYSWHMFLFMAVSGYTSGISKKRIDLSWIKQRFERLIIPLAIWTLIILMIDKNLTCLEFIKKMTIEPVLWYLLVQFLLDCIFAISRKTKKMILTIIIIFIIICITYMLGCNNETAKSLIMYYPFYFTGCYVGMHKHFFEKKFGKIIWISLLLFPISMYMYSWKDYTRVSNITQNILSFFDFPDSVVIHIINFMENIGFKVYNHAIVSVLGCIFFICITKGIAKLDKLKSMQYIFSYIGKKTIYIYILHMWFVKIFNLSSFINILMACICGVIIPCIISEILKYIPALDKLLFGAKIKKVSNSSK